METTTREQSVHNAMKELRRDFERRLNDIQAEMEHGRTNTAEDALAMLRKEFERKLSGVRDKIDNSLEPGRETVRDKPLATLGVSMVAGLVAGMICGVLLGRKSDE